MLRKVYAALAWMLGYQKTLNFVIPNKEAWVAIGSVCRQHLAPLFLRLMMEQRPEIYG